GPAHALLGGTVLHLAYHSADGEFAVHTMLQILEIRKRGVAEMLHLNSEIIERMPRDVDAHHFLLLLQLGHGAPFLTRRDHRLGDLNFAGIATEAYLGGSLVFLILGRVFTGLVAGGGHVAPLVTVI